MSGEQLRERRKALGLTQEELAFQLGVDITTLEQWESGARAIPGYLVRALDAVEGRLKKSRGAGGPNTP